MTLMYLRYSMFKPFILYLNTKLTEKLIFLDQNTEINWNLILL